MDPRQIGFGGMTPPAVYPGRYLATSGGSGYRSANGGGRPGGGGGGYFESPQPAYQQILYTGGHAPALSSPTLVIPNRKIHTPTAFPSVAPAQPPSASTGLRPTFAAVGRASPPSVSGSESCPSSPSAEASSVTLVAYGLAEELRQMQVERTGLRSPGPAAYKQLPLEGVEGKGKSELGELGEGWRTDENMARREEGFLVWGFSP